VIGRIQNFVGINLGSSIDERCKHIQNNGKGFLAVGLGVRCLVPKANEGDSVFAGGKEGELILESVLLAEQGYNFLLHQETEF